TTLGTVLYGSALDPQRGHLFVAESSPAPALAVTSIAMLDTHTGALLRAFALPRTAQHVYQPHVLAVAAASGQLWVLSQCSQPNPSLTVPPCPDAVSMLDPRTGQFRQVAELGALGALGGSLVVDDPAQRVAVLARGTLSLLNVQTGLLVQRLPEPFATALTVDETTGRLYVVGAMAPAAPPSLGRVGVFDSRTGALLWSVQGAQAVVLDQRHGRLIVACDPTPVAALCQYDSRTGRLLLRSNAPGHFVVRAVDAADGLLLGLSSLTGRAGVLDERTGKVLWSLQVGATPGAQSGASQLSAVVFDAQTGRAFVLNNPAATAPTAGLVNTLITLLIPRHATTL
ncbi:MAG TPA: PQQ-binding-like beta-propeller repeat protein, partial [Chloroflexota bacterium]|nr:PQQ-binding-like beta-propeller repeat protein [Chloroflexota bacterium]